MHGRLGVSRTDNAITRSARGLSTTTGTITVDGAPLTEMDRAAWRGRVTSAFQDFSRFPFLAREAVGVGNPPMLPGGQWQKIALSRAFMRSRLLLAVLDAYQ